MKFNASLALIVICGLVACSQALPAKRLTYYQQPAAAPYYAAPQRMMFMRYVQPSYGHARSHQAAAALVSGDSGATGTYLEGADHVVAATEVQEDSVAAAAGHVAQSVAEAYPAAASSAEEEPKITVQVDLDPASSAEPSDNDAKEGREYNYDVAEVAGAAGVSNDAANEVENAGAEAGSATVTVGFSGAAESEVPAAAPAPIAPVTPAKRYLPAKKKVIVELEQAAEEETENAVATQDDEDVVDENDDAYAPVPVAPKVPAARRPAARKPTKAGSNQQKPQPVGTFFPVDFGGATGGAIAIANSFSTSESGSATSHAIAYGNPDTSRAQLRPSRRH